MNIEKKEELNEFILSMIDQSLKTKEKQIKLIKVKGFDHCHGKAGEPFEHSALLIGNKYYFLNKYIDDEIQNYSSRRDFIQNATILTESLLGTTNLQGYKIAKTLDSLVHFYSKNMDMNSTDNQHFVFQTFLQYLRIEKQIPENLDFVRSVLAIKRYEKKMTYCIIF